MQDKNIAISELKKLIENCKGKSVETQFNKPSVVRQPNAQRIQNHQFLRKTPCFSNSPGNEKFSKRQQSRGKPTGRIFSNVRLRWIPTGKLFNSCTGKVDSEPTHGSIVDIPHIHACKQTLGLSAGKSFNGQKQQRIELNADALYNAKQENLRVWPRSSMFKRRLITADQALVFMAMTSDHNRSELGIHDHSNEPSSLKLVLKVVPLAVKTATSRQELELLFHHHIAMLRTTDRYKQKIGVGGIMGLAAVGPVVLRRCWHRQSCVSRALCTLSVS
ncbi:hypothetical protein Tco_0816527 [Tanacetum coccineum]